MNGQSLKDFSVLYLEDDLASRKVMSIILERVMGIKTFAVFENSVDFLTHLKSLTFKPSIFLIDIHVPPHDGFEVLHMLRNDPEHRSAIVIALTASVMIEEVRQLQTAGFDGAISKPIDHRKFPGLLERIVEGESVWNIS